MSRLDGIVEPIEESRIEEVAVIRMYMYYGCLLSSIMTTPGGDFLDPTAPKSGKTLPRHVRSALVPAVNMALTWLLGHRCNRTLASLLLLASLHIYQLELSDRVS